jgi:hypothetical protein
MADIINSYKILAGSLKRREYLENVSVRTKLPVQSSTTKQSLVVNLTFPTKLQYV